MYCRCKGWFRTLADLCPLSAHEIMEVSLLYLGHRGSVAGNRRFRYLNQHWVTASSCLFISLLPKSESDQRISLGSKSRS